MKSLSFRLCVLLLLAASAAADPYDSVLAGACFDSRDGGTAFSGALVNGSFVSFDSPVENVAQAPEGRVFGFSNFRLVEILPDRTVVPLFPHNVTPQSPVHMVVAADGTTYILIPDSPPLVRVVSPAGALRDIVLPDPGLPSDAGIDLGADQCTLYYIQGSSASAAIKRFNVCTETALPDFAAVAEFASDVRVLPDGGVLAATDAGLRRYDAAGNFTRLYPTGAAKAIGLTAGGAVALVSHSCRTPDLERVDLASGALTTIPFAELGTVDIVPYRSWTAALGASHATDVPTTSTVALSVLGVLLVLAACVRLH